MKTYFISRHPGAIQWVKNINLHVDEFIEHIDSESFKKGDTVIGTLPINKIHELQNNGVTVLSLILDLTRNLRGHELSYEQLIACNARLVNYAVTIA